MISYENSHTKYLDGKLIDKLIPFMNLRKILPRYSACKKFLILNLLMRE